MSVYPTRGSDGHGRLRADYLDLTHEAKSFTGLAAFGGRSFNLVGDGEPERLEGASVSRSFFDVLGVHAALGRTFTPAEDKAGAPAVAVVGRRYWVRRFGGRADAIGATLTLNGAPYAVVGTLGFDLPSPFDDVDVWAPRVDEVTGFPRNLIDGGLGYLTAVARVAPEVRVEQAQSEVDAIAHAYARATRPTPMPIPPPA